MAEYSLVVALIALVVIVVIGGPRGLGTQVWCTFAQAGMWLGYSMNGTITDIDGDGDGDNLDLLRITRCMRP